MLYRTTTVSEPTFEILTLDEIKAQIKLPLSYVAEDTHLTLLNKAISHNIERVTKRIFPQRTVVSYLSEWPSEAIELPKFPVQSVTSIEYQHADTGVWTTLHTDDYDVSATDFPTRVTRAYEVDWPSVRGVEENIRITYVVGVAAVTDIPFDVKAAALLMAAHLYVHREAVVIGPNPIEVPLAVARLLNVHTFPSIR